MACGDNEEITVVDFRWAEWVCIAAILSRSCSLWVKKRTSEQVRVMSALCQKQTFMAYSIILTHRMEISGQFRQIRCRESRVSQGHQRACVRESRNPLPPSVGMTARGSCICMAG